MRIMVIGRSGSGKTVFADRLGRMTDVPVIHLDKLYFNPDWSVAYAKDDFNDIVEQKIDLDAWIIDGNYSSTMDQRIARADVIVFFDLPFLVCLGSVLKRALFPIKNLPDKHPGMRDRVSLKLIQQMYTYPTQMVLDKIRKNDKAEVYFLKSHSEAEELLRLLSERGVGSAARSRAS